MRNQIEGAFNDAMDQIVFKPVEQLSIFQRMFNTLFSLFVIYIVMLSIAAVFFHFIEGKDLTDSYWWAAVTATTVGYGDLYPSQPWGRFMAAVFMNLCAFLLAPVITAKLSAKMIVDSDAFTHDEQEEIKKRQIQSLENQEILIQKLNDVIVRLDKLEAER